ncbi:hypothetical protein HMI54_006969 [Coelomomyces lativittatus]|nr:hypothetical protein HMI56_002921 [Coelomomyces lativittatus]KAJ1504462.1 hypothetical protein HMI54_006969 [Coelomomyces lativittatus]
MYVCDDPSPPRSPFLFFFFFLFLFLRPSSLSSPSLQCPCGIDLFSLFSSFFLNLETIHSFESITLKQFFFFFFKKIEMRRKKRPRRIFIFIFHFSYGTLQTSGV